MIVLTALIVIVAVKVYVIYKLIVAMFDCDDP